MGENLFQRIAIIVCIAFIMQLTYCKKKRPIEDFDSETWIDDQYGCNGDRLELMNDILKIKFKMRGKKTVEIEDILGNPEGIELYKRDQKYYIYYIESNENCADGGKENPLKLYVRFSAVGIANEFTIRTD